MELGWIKSTISPLYNPSQYELDLGTGGKGVSVSPLYNSRRLVPLRRTLTITLAKLTYNVKYLSWSEYMHEVTLIPI